jgi:DNA-binding transcriptional LysR family regulator
MNLRHLQYFIAVAEELHFGRAAERLHIAQPPLSQMIRRLEAELEVTLLRRNRRSVELTAAGNAFLQHARLALAEIERGREAAGRAARGETGQLVLGMVPSGDTKLFTEVLRRFGERFPEVRLVLQSLSTTAQVEAIQEGRLDAGFLRMPVAAPRLELRVISRETLVVALPSGHRLAKRAKLTLAELSDEPNIMFPRRLAPDYYDTIVSLFRQSGHRLRIAQEAEHVQMHLSLIAGGFGLSLLPSSMRDFQLEGVAYRPIVDPVPVVETAIGFRRDDRSEVLRSLLNVVDEAARRLALAPGGPLRTHPSATEPDRNATSSAARRQRKP